MKTAKVKVTDLGLGDKIVHNDEIVTIDRISPMYDMHEIDYIASGLSGNMILEGEALVELVK